MLNSAPVQLLPIDNGSGNKRSAESVKNAGPDERFDDVYESVVKNGKSGASEKKSSDVSRRKEGSGRTDETESAESRKKRRTKGREDQETAAASVQHDVRIKNAVEELKSGLSSERAKPGAHAAEADFSGTSKRFRQSDALALKLAAVKKEAGRGGLKSAAETGFAALNFRNSVDGKIAENSTADSADAGALKLSEKLSEAAASVKKTAEGGPSVKPSIELVSSEAGRLVSSGLTVDPKESSLKTGKSAGKLRVVDHRQPQSVDGGKGEKTNSSTESGSFKSAIDAAARDTELNPSASILKSESRTPETKLIQSSVQSQLRETVNSQIVKQAGIIVKGNGTGEIKLVMKPESLGKVRIQLSLHDNHIAGRIIVENNIVKEIFESNLENLYKAFGSEGFENGGLEVSVQGQGGEADGNGRKNGRGFNGRIVKAIEDAVPELVDSEWRNNAVNMVV